MALHARRRRRRERLGGTGLLSYTREVQLEIARLCLDCDEVHEAQLCPQCGSETFAYLRRWVPQTETRPRRTPLPPPEPSGAAAREAGGAGSGLGVAGIPEWLRRRNKNA